VLILFLDYSILFLNESYNHQCLQVWNVVNRLLQTVEKLTNIHIKTKKGMAQKYEATRLLLLRDK